MPLAIEVLLPLPLPPFRYLLPPDLAPARVGARVAVPWQSGTRIGLCISTARPAASQALELREAIAWLDEGPFVTPAGVALLQDLADYTHAPQGVILANLLPFGFHDPLDHQVRAVPGTLGLALREDGWLDAAALAPEELDLYRRQGMIEERVRIAPRTERRLVAARAPDGDLAGAAQANQRRALEHLERASAASAAELARAAGVPDSAVRALVRKGYAEYRELPAPPPAPPAAPPPPVDPWPATPPPPLPDGDPSAITGGLRHQRLATLLPALQADLRAGRSPLVLVPELARLDETTALLAPHAPTLRVSGDLDDDQRRQAWREAAHGPPAVVVGTYLALLVPAPNPGRIVVLEAGSGAYKLPSGARLFVPTAAQRYARRLGVPVTLTDTLETPEMRLGTPADGWLRLPPPDARVHVSDLGRVDGWPIGSELALVLRQVQARSRQAVIISSRRGYSAALACTDCAQLIMCPNCDLPLRYHRAERNLRCHQCAHTQPPPPDCPHCHGELAPSRGAGTQWLATTAAKLLPGFPVLRHDRDHQDDLTPLYRGEPGVLVATTAALRLPPLPNASLIALALLDTHLSLSDFRAGEETLRLLLQLPELAPNARPLTLIQTFQPDHPVLDLLRHRDLPSAIDAFLESTMERRRAFDYPPYTHLAKVQITARDRASAETAARRAASTLQTAGATPHELLGPTPAPIARVKNHYAYQLLVRSPDEDRFKRLLDTLGRGAGGATVRVDVDPRDILEFLE